MKRNPVQPIQPKNPQALLSRGVTVLEIVIVVCLAVTLLTILIPTLQRQINGARATTCADHLGKIYQALLNYSSNHDGWWPEWQVRTEADLVKDENVWIQLLHEGDYTTDVRIFACPSDPNAPRFDQSTPQFHWRQAAYAPSYGLNELTWAEYGVAATDDPGLKRKPKTRSSTILLADMGPDVQRDTLPEEPFQRFEAIATLRQAGRLAADDGFRVGVVRPNQTWLTGRHDLSLNLLAMGGQFGASPSIRGMIDARPEAYYDDCAIGGCTFCNVFKSPHYDFSSSKMYWWTGSYYSEQSTRPITSSTKDDN